MQINFSALMAAFVMLAVGVLISARGRVPGPAWLVPVVVLGVFPLAHLVVGNFGNAPDGLLRWTFEASCGLLVAVMAGPFMQRAPRSAS